MCGRPRAQHHVRRRSRHGAVLDHLEHDERHRDRYLLDPVQVRLLVLDRVLHLHDLHDPAATIVEHVHTHPLGDEPMSAITSLRPRRGRNVELLLLLFAVGIVVLAYVSVEAAVHDAVPAGLLTQAGGLLAIELADAEAVHALVRHSELLVAATSFGGIHTSVDRRARWGDPVAPGFARIAAGIEDTADLVADVQQALDAR